MKNSPTYNLRYATANDCELMFRLQKLDGNSISNEHQEEFAQYQKEFAPEKIQVIELDGTSVGRLRVVRDGEIYIGGLQILPQYRNMGIGTAVLTELIAEADMSQKPIKLEVFKTNTLAIELYSRLGFKTVDETDTQKIMKYVPQ